MRRRGDLEALVATAIERFKRLDVIVNCAGIGPISRFDALRVEEWDAMIDDHLHRPFPELRRVRARRVLLPVHERASFESFALRARRSGSHNPLPP
ncbi:MAG: SDR family NAD(P)-dependent oxidoreductase, partial [Jannaschia sp.]